MPPIKMFTSIVNELLNKFKCVNNIISELGRYLYFIQQRPLAKI
jgi:hypothetical protein